MRAAGPVGAFYPKGLVQHREPEYASQQLGSTEINGTTLAAPARRRGGDVFVYFDNDVTVRAPFDAIGLAEGLGAGRS